MKWFSLSLLAALAVLISACEQHSAAETQAALEPEGGKASEAAAPAADPASATAESKPAPEKPAASDEKPAKFFDSK